MLCASTRSTGTSRVMPDPTVTPMPTTVQFLVVIAPARKRRPFWEFVAAAIESRPWCGFRRETGDRRRSDM
ncbi:MAG: hypothetical protein WBP81_14430 [Solirubrobacteraceae bacterium]